MENDSAKKMLLEVLLELVEPNKAERVKLIDDMALITQMGHSTVNTMNIFFNENFTDKSQRKLITLLYITVMNDIIKEMMRENIERKQITKNEAYELTQMVVNELLKSSKENL